jgi:hypothetical protein
LEGYSCSPIKRVSRYVSSWKTEWALDSPIEVFADIIRLQFSLDGADVKTFNEAITSTLGGFTFNSLDVICKKAVVLADTDDGNQPVAQGSVIFEAKYTIKPEGKSDVPVIASVSFYHGSYNITVQLRTKDAFGGILSWLMGLVPGLDLKFISDFLGDKN